MSDNVTLNAGSGGSVLRTKDRTGVETSIVAIDLNPAGSEVLMAGAMPVTGTFWQATQPVSIAAALTISGSVAVTGTFFQATQPVSIAAPVAVTGTFWQTTQPIIGTVTANAGTNLNTSTLALETGGNLATIAGRTPALGQALAAASIPVVLTAAQLTTLTPISTVSISGSVAVTGTFWQATQPVSGTVAATQSGSWTNTVTQATAASLNATVVGTGTFAVQATQSGTWNVGTVTTVTTVSAVTAITNALPAGTNLLGSIASGPQIALALNGTTPVTVQYANFSTSSSGATQVVALSAGKKIYVLRWRVSANGTTNVNLQSHTTTALATGINYLPQFGSAGGATCPFGIMATASGEALDVNNSNAVAISGEVTYVQF